MNKPKLFLFGGFLGSGKTTLLTRVGSELTRTGAKVAVITNDQGEFLVDTAYAGSLGLAAGEVLKGCFCCKFSDFIGSVERIIKEVQPDYILAEPVGSCTDLTATVVNPLLLHHRNLVQLCGFFVLADGPRLIGEYSRMDLLNPLTPREVLVSHQIREASILILSKTDLLLPWQRVEAKLRLQELNPPAIIIETSALEEEGVSELARRLAEAGSMEMQDPLDLDYELYAAAEAEMGWFNARFDLKGPGGFSAVDAATGLLVHLKGDLNDGVSHAKVLIVTADGSVKLSLAGGRIHADTALDPLLSTNTGTCLVNIRGGGTPDELSRVAQSAIERTCTEFKLVTAEYREESLIPAPPQPLYRISTEGVSL